MSLRHAAIYLAILLILAVPFALVFMLIRWVVRRSRG